MHYVDCTPTWSDIIRVHIETLKNGDPTGSAEKEIIRMAALADERNEMVKNLKLRH